MSDRYCGPLGLHLTSEWLDDGTLFRGCSPRPGALGLHLLPGSLQLRSELPNDCRGRRFLQLGLLLPRTLRGALYALPSRTQPPLVDQATEFDCWAAAISSWLSAVKPPYKAQTQKQLLDKWGLGGIDLSTFDKVARSIDMNYKVLEGFKEFMPERIEELVDKFKVVLVGFVVGTGKKPWWHDVLIYDVITPFNIARGLLSSSSCHDVLIYDATIPFGKEAAYSIMDPGPSGAAVDLAGSAKAQYMAVTQKFFFPKGKNQQWLIGWSKTATKG